MSSYNFSLAQHSDKALITEFMDTYWGNEHPIIHNDLLFKHYYLTQDRLQFALCRKECRLVALCGYILCSHAEIPDVWVSIWLAVKGENGAGLELMANLRELCGARVIACNNIRFKTIPFYSFLGYTAERLPHYYRILDKNEYSVCKIEHKRILPVSIGRELIEIKSAEELASCFTPCESRRPYKDLWYIKHRYFEYPYLAYNVWRLSGTEKTDTLLVTRTLDVDGTNIIKVVDYTGAPTEFERFGYAIAQLQDSLNAEYVEMYCYGISPAQMQNAGFCERTKEDKSIIPNYLTPPLYENTEYYFFTSCPDGFTMFKADGDQDRPNIV